MQLVVIQLVYGMMDDVIRHLYDSVKNVWLEMEMDEEDEFLLSLVAIKGEK